jgi:hypothetical protein
MDILTQEQWLLNAQVEFDALRTSPRHRSHHPRHIAPALLVAPVPVPPFAPPGRPTSLPVPNGRGTTRAAGARLRGCLPCRSLDLPSGCARRFGSRRAALQATDKFISFVAICEFRRRAFSVLFSRSRATFERRTGIRGATCCFPVFSFQLAVQRVADILEGLRGRFQPGDVEERAGINASDSLSLVERGPAQSGGRAAAFRDFHHIRLPSGHGG